ncbi:cytochrome c-type biogenesis protein [Alteripontixanthobacter maritimus]
MAGLLMSLLLVTSVPLGAQSAPSTAPYADTQLADPAQEAEARDLMETLRCVECQSQSIADSDAPLAGDMRSIVRERIESGDSPEQVREWLVDRYGDYISYAPVVRASTWPLFAIPLILILLAGMLLRRRLSVRRARRDERT